MAKRKVKKRKIKGKKLLLFLIFVVAIIYGVYYIYSLKITSITVKGNTLYKDWEIIKIAKLDKYPKSMENLSGMISHRLEKDAFIKKAKVTKKRITEVNIEIIENKPLFYYVPNNKTVLADKTEVDEAFSVPTLVNYVPNKIYDKFLNEMNNVDYGIIKRISEIKYDPNEVDDERFLLTMNDGNYVYLTLYKFNKVNHYIDIIKEFDNKKGVLYLDSGEYFKVA